MLLFRTVVRVLLVAPLLAVLAAAIAECSTSPFVWSEARSYTPFSVPDWVASLSPFIVAAPGLVAGSLGTVSVVRATRQRFSVSPAGVIVGLFGCFALSIINYGLYLRGNAYASFTYGSIFSKDARLPIVSLPVTILTTVVFLGTAAAGVFIYTKAIESEGTGRFDKRVDERDGIGELLVEREVARGLRRR